MYGGRRYSLEERSPLGWLMLVGALAVILLGFSQGATVPGAPEAARALGGIQGEARTLSEAIAAAQAARSTPEAARAPTAAPVALNGRPTGLPVGTSHIEHGAVVITQGYGVGTHAPADTWGGLDFAVDSNGDGEGDRSGTLEAPLLATVSGTVRLSQTHPCGNGIEILNERYRVLYCHLADFAVEDGAQVQPGRVIGYVGESGKAFGAHLHYEIWENGKNVDPTGYLGR